MKEIIKNTFISVLNFFGYNLLTIHAGTVIISGQYVSWKRNSIIVKNKPKTLFLDKNGKISTILIEGSIPFILSGVDG